MILLRNNQIVALEVKWAEQIRANDLKTLKQFHSASILTKHNHPALTDGIHSLPVYKFLLNDSDVDLNAL